MSKIVIVSCTQSTSKQDCDKLQIVKSYNEVLSQSQTTYDIDLITGNKQGLPVVYNQALQSKLQYDWLVFAHDDVYIDDARLYQKLELARVNHGFDIVGTAGCLNPAIKQYNLWHVMSDRKDHRGHVAHPTNTTYNSEKQIAVSSFGPSPGRVAIIDGLLIAVYTPSIKRTNWKFNENYTFHHYDMSSCIDANKLKLKVGVYPINVIHTSPGLLSVDDVSWAASNKQFLQEYGKQQ